MKRGEICWITMPDTGDHVQSGARPHLIMQNDSLSAKLSTVIVVPFTSKLRTTEYPATLLVQASAANGLRSDSGALVFQATAVDKRRLRERIGELEPEYLEAAERELQKLIGPSLPPSPGPPP